MTRPREMSVLEASWFFVKWGIIWLLCPLNPQSIYAVHYRLLRYSELAESAERRELYLMLSPESWVRHYWARVRK